jgi:histidinol-phosphate aminotransferase
MSAFSLSELVRPELSELSPYLPVLGDFPVRLDANEAPRLLSEQARARLGEIVASTDYSLYPDPTVGELRRAIARKMGTSPEEVLVGVGSDELITLLLTALDRPRKKESATAVLTTTPTFVMYRMSARVRGMRVMEVPLDESWDLPVDQFSRAIEFAEPNLVFIASPNNPTGNLMSEDRLSRIIEAAPRALVVVDEAYIGYASRDQLALYRRHENVAILRTLSKTGFAALRVGWLVGRPALVAELDKARLPYNVNTLSQKLATAVLTELDHEVERITKSVIEERRRLTAELSERRSLGVTSSDANFLWVRTPVPAGDVFSELCRKGVLVRSFHGRGGRLTNQLRVTVGARAENDRFLEALDEALGA